MSGEWVWAALLGALGLFVGSFLALVSVRWPKSEPIGLARSACRACGRKLGATDLLPLLSFALLRGRCRTCGGRIDARYPLIEGACLLIGAWAGLSAATGGAAVVTASLGWVLLLIAVLDAEHFWLPDALTFPLGLAGFLQALALAPGTLDDRLIGAVIGFVSLAALAFGYRRLRGREGLGGGDPRLFGAAGAWVGWAGLPSVLLWACAAAFSLVVARATTGKGVRADDRLPLGAYLALGLWLTWLFGPIGL